MVHWAHTSPYTTMEPQLAHPYLQGSWMCPTYRNTDHAISEASNIILQPFTATTTTTTTTTTNNNELLT